MLTLIMICWWYFQLWGHHDVSNQDWRKQNQENTRFVSLLPGETLFTSKVLLWSEDGYNTSWSLLWMYYCVLWQGIIQ